MGDGALASDPIKLLHCCHSDNSCRGTNRIRWVPAPDAESSNDVPWGTFTKPTLTGWLFFAAIQQRERLSEENVGGGQFIYLFIL